MQDMAWDPFTILGLEVPNKMFDGFNTPEVKKAYRKLSR